LRKPHKICENPLKEPVFVLEKGFSQAKNGTGLSLFANLLLAGQFISANGFPSFPASKFENAAITIF